VSSKYYTWAKENNRRPSTNPSTNTGLTPHPGPQLPAAVACVLWPFLGWEIIDGRNGFNPLILRNNTVCRLSGTVQGKRGSCYPYTPHAVTTIGSRKRQTWGYCEVKRLRSSSAKVSRPVAMGTDMTLLLHITTIRPCPLCASILHITYLCTRSKKYNDQITYRYIWLRRYHNLYRTTGKRVVLKTIDVRDLNTFCTYHIIQRHMLIGPSPLTVC
jgi:hypothetical protein